MIPTTLLHPIHWRDCNTEEKVRLLTRPAINNQIDISIKVSEILKKVHQEGDEALSAFNLCFDHTETPQIRVTDSAIIEATKRLSPTIKQAMKQAKANIYKFHRAQQLTDISIETQPGVYCKQLIRPIDTVGLYIPGGSAPLLSTVLMLAIPANIAGCRRIILCSPPPIADEIIYAAFLCNVQDIYQVGGAQAIAAMAFGTQTIIKVDKIFGPGNIWVTEAKRQVSQHLKGTAIDMPAGPSEVLIIADSQANPAFIAADLLSQAEHGPDSQVLLITPDEIIAHKVAEETILQMQSLSRIDVIRQSLLGSRIIIADNLAECITISNIYGPEHLIIQTDNAGLLVDRITKAGSIFIGQWSPESAGDYASGTNHVLPTYGHTATCSSLGLADFQKRMTAQELTPNGLMALSSTVETLSQAEHLSAHKHAITIRVTALKEQQ